MRSCSSPLIATNACHSLPRWITASAGTTGRGVWPTVTWASANMPGTRSVCGSSVASTISARLLLISPPIRRDLRAVGLAGLGDRRQLDLLVVLDRADRGLGDRQLDPQRVVVDQREQRAAGGDPLAGRDRLLGDLAVERRADQAVADRLGDHVGAGLGGADLLQGRRALRHLAVVLAARDRALVEQHLLALALLLGELLLGPRRLQVGLRPRAPTAPRCGRRAGPPAGPS